MGYNEIMLALQVVSCVCSVVCAGVAISDYCTSKRA